MPNEFSPDRAVINLIPKPEEAPVSSTWFSLAYAPDQPELGKPGKTAGDILLVQNGKANTILVSLGPRDKSTPEAFRKAGGQAGKWLRSNPTPSVDLSTDDFDSFEPGSLQAFLEGLRLGGYAFDLHKKKEHPLQPVTVFVAGADEMVEFVQTVTGAVLLARDWAHEPANIINPVSLANHAAQLAESAGLRVRIMDEKELESLGAGAILAVGRGSQTPPRLIVLEYPGSPENAEQKPVVLVGKALTFDSGGYSIKDTTNIQGMKYDKCGGIAAMATIMAAAQLKLKVPVVAIIGAAENLISSHAYRPDDILTTLSGKTVEIVTTDAEGRLVLADALTFAQQSYSPRCMIDLATLTGGVVVALGRVRAGIMGNDSQLIDRLIEAGDRTMERLWQLPLDEEYLQSTKGDDADLKNSGGREGHPIMGGIFLKQFVDDSIPWAHLDIAGVADLPKDAPYAPKGATGFGVRLLIDYLKNLE